MGFEQKDNSGALFKNQKDQPNWPDYKGSIMVDGKEYWLSAWIKTTREQEKFMSLAVQPKDRKSKGAQQPASQPKADKGFEDDDIPF